MNILSSKHFADKKALFVWDGSGQWLEKADRVISSMGTDAVYAVHAMPHESIYHYGGVCKDSKRINWMEMELCTNFEDKAKSLDSFRDVSLTLLFGEKVIEIARFTNRFKVDTVVMPRFEQSSFSKWLHGDLNAKLASKVFGSITILNDKTIFATPKASRTRETPKAN